MAVKPMDFFRKYQKWVFAALTLLAMFLFIIGDPLSMGQGGGRQRDGFFSKVTSWFTGGNKEKAIATLKGTYLDEETLSEVNKRRTAATQCLFTLKREGEARFLKSIGFADDELSSFKKMQKINSVAQANPKKLDPLSMAYGTLAWRLSQFSNPTAMQYMQMGMEIGPMLNTSAEAAVQFINGQKKADELGVVITPEIVQSDIRTLSFNQFTDDQIQMFLGGFGMKPKDMLAAISEEFRVNMADQITEPEFAGINNPFKLWQGYVDVKTNLKVGILPLEASAFADKVPAPSQAELQAYYDKYRTQIPDPNRETPGFKVPNLYRLGFVYADINENQGSRKHYEKFVPVVNALSPLSALHELYFSYQAKRETSYKISQPFVDMVLPRKVDEYARIYELPIPVLDAQGVADVVSRTLLATGPAGVAAAIPFGPRVQPVPANEANAQKYALQLSSLLANVWQGLPSQVTAMDVKLGDRVGDSNRYQSFNEVYESLAKDRQTKLIETMATDDLAALQKEVVEYGKAYQTAWGTYRRNSSRNPNLKFTPPMKDEKANLSFADYVRKFAADRGMLYEETKEARSRVELLNEGSQHRPLNTLIVPMFVSKNLTEPKQVKDSVKTELLGFDTERRASYAPKLAVEQDGKQRFATHWIVEEQDTRVPTFTEAQPKVLEAWKLEKARDLLDAEAKRIKADLAAQADNVKKLRDMKGYVDNQTMSRFKEPEVRTTTVGTSFEMGTLPTVLEDVPSDLLDNALKELKKPQDVFTSYNKAKNRLYVIHLIERSEPKADQGGSIAAFDYDAMKRSVMNPFSIVRTDLAGYASNLSRLNTSRTWQKYFQSATNFNENLGKAFDGKRGGAE